MTSVTLVHSSPIGPHSDLRSSGRYHLGDINDRYYTLLTPSKILIGFYWMVIFACQFGMAFMVVCTSNQRYRTERNKADLRTRDRNDLCCGAVWFCLCFSSWSSSNDLHSSLDLEAFAPSFTSSLSIIFGIVLLIGLSNAFTVYRAKDLIRMLAVVYLSIALLINSKGTLQKVADAPQVITALIAAAAGCVVCFIASFVDFGSGRK
ncbi:hypothetical protein H4Q26_012814 [Puccinia striiformis f. sp. tritici PST-130]|nr:hypothetical protein H4Q26_012814 [Puccinia striiformis f. sp. tritici PST-130]